MATTVHEEAQQKYLHASGAVFDVTAPVLQPHLGSALSAQAKQVTEDRLAHQTITCRPRTGGLRKRGNPN